MAGYKEFIKEYPNFPVEGVNFKDLSPLIADQETFRSAVVDMVRQVRKPKFTGQKLITQVRFLPRPLILNYIIMPNMSYCRFENTAKDMQDCIYAIEERDVYDFSNYELRGFKEVFELAQEIVNMEDDIERIIEYYEN